LALFNLNLHSQTKLLWDDQQDLVSSAGETLLFSQLAENDIEVVMTLDYKKRCEYLYAEMTGSSGRATLTIYDCNRKIVGQKSWLSKFFGLSEEERVFMIAYAIAEIVESPGEVKDQSVRSAKSDVRFADSEFMVPFNHHNSRHFFSPTSYNLRRGELYYSTLFFLVHDFQYGITDKLSFGMGTTLFPLPFYITPKYSQPIDAKSTISVGSIMLVGAWGLDFFGNLAYATYTRGNQFDNITFGAGHLYFEAEGFHTNNLVANLSGMKRLSDHFYLVSENYFVPMRENINAYYYSTPDMWQWEFRETSHVSSYLFSGMTGFRFINMEQDISAWQFGLSYVSRFRQPIPAKYSGSNWDVHYNSGDWKRFFFPTISFVRKLGKRV
jgi:hypothetical protein